MREVQGWCLGRDAQGVPKLDECWLVEGAGGRFFMQGQNSAGEWLTLRSYQLGETFFRSKANALEECLKQLNTQYVRYATILDRLDRQIHQVVDELEEMQEAGNAGRG